MNVKILILAIIFGVTETAFFGWNSLPESPAEVVCDGITMLILALAFMRA